MSSAGRYRLARRSLLSVLVAVLACVVLASSVSAFVSRRTHVVNVPVSGKDIPGPWTAFGFGSSTATCPTGQHVLFGGFDGGFMGGQGMRRTANNRWTTDAFNILASLYPPFRSSLTSFVYCGYGPVPSKATSTVELGGGASRSATARCPAGTVVVGGGFAISPHTKVTVRALERVAADRWRVLASLLWDSHTALTAVAYCGPGPAPKLMSRALNIYGSSGTARATCPVGTQLVFGGGILTASGSEYSFLQTLRADTRSTWSAGGRGDKVTALAYCR